MVEKQKAVVENGVQKIRITAEKGYSPKEFQLQKGIPAEITFHRVNPSGCYKEILFEDQGILEPLEVGVDKVISFTPTETGDFEFSCGMKMQKGSYTVVEKRRRVLSLLGRFWITSIFTLPLLILMIGMWQDLSPIQSVAGDFSSDNADHVGSRSSFYQECLGLI